MLDRALASVAAQEEEVDYVVSIDEDFTGSYRPGGAALTRNQGLEAVETEWVAFLDDDDELYPQHVSHCLAKAHEVGADLVYPWFDGGNSVGILWTMKDGQQVSPEGVEFGPEQRAWLMEDVNWQNGADLTNFIPVTVVVRTELVRAVGGFPVPGTEEWPHPNCEDHGLWKRLLSAGAEFAHLPERTWRYNIHGSHLSVPPCI